MWICHVANNSPLPSFSICDQVIVSHNQEIAEPRPRFINTSIDQEARHKYDSENATLCQETYSGEPSQKPLFYPIHPMKHHTAAYVHLLTQ